MAVNARRPLKTRRRRWATGLARWLTGRRVQPNAISVAGLVAAGLAGACLLAVPGRPAGWQVVLLLAGASFIQLRLLANMLDGLVAVEGGLHAPTGDLFNEVPDRLADLLILVSAGYAIPGLSVLGWLSGVLAVLTAYVRLLGGSLGRPQDFSGPMAKPHRMATLTLGCVLSVMEVLGPGYRGRVLAVGLVVIALGSAITAARRLWRIRSGLLAR